MPQPHRMRHMVETSTGANDVGANGERHLRGRGKSRITGVWFEIVRRRSVGAQMADTPDEPRRQKEPSCRGQRLKLPDVPHAVFRRLVPDDQFEVDGRLGESRQLQTHEDATVGTGAGLRGGGLIDVTPVKLVRESKEGLTGRRRTPPRLAARYPASLNGRETRVAVTALPAPSVHQHIDPRRSTEPAAQRRVGVRSADRDDDDPS
jgi:hypothetical protein